MNYRIEDVVSLLDYGQTALSSEVNALVLAEQICRDVLQSDPKNYEALLSLGRLALENAQCLKAKNRLSKLVGKPSSDWRALYHLGLAQQGLGLFPEASTSLLKALSSVANGDRIELNASTVQIMSELGRTFLAGGADSEAQRYYQAVLDYVKAAVRAAPTASSNEALPSYAPPATRVFPILYIPVEIKARELPAKLLVAAHAVAAGFTVVIAQTWSLLSGDISDLPPGVIFFKTINSIDAGNADLARKAGHLTCSLDEEAFGRATRDTVYKQNTDRHAVSKMDLLMTQGRAHATVLSRLHPEAESRIRVTGTPRAQLLASIKERRTERAELDHKERKVKPYILICTMFGNVNPAGRGFANTAKTTFELAGASDTTQAGAESNTTFEDCVTLELNLFGEIRDIVLALAKKFPEVPIVVRPHPAEDGSIWQALFSNIKSVRVEGNGPLSDWLVNASSMIYLPGCATGVEARLAGVPALCFQGAGSDSSAGIGLSEQINTGVQTVVDAVAWVRTAHDPAAKVESPPGEQSVLDDHFHIEPEHTAAELVADALADLQREYAHPGDMPLQALRELETTRQAKFVARSFHQQKFPQTPKEEIVAALDLITQAVPGMPKLQVQAVGDNIFLIRA